MSVRGILDLVTVVQAWQETVIEELEIEVDGDWYVPSWVLGGEGIPAHRLWELREFARTWVRSHG